MIAVVVCAHKKEREIFNAFLFTLSPTSADTDCVLLFLSDGTKHPDDDKIDWKESFSPKCTLTRRQMRVAYNIAHILKTRILIPLSLQDA